MTIKIITVEPAYKPPGPLPLYLTDLEEKTPGWPDVDRLRYLRVLWLMWVSGGAIPDDDNVLCEAMKLRKGRGYKDSVQRIRSKLIHIGNPADVPKANALGQKPNPLGLSEKALEAWTYVFAKPFESRLGYRLVGSDLTGLLLQHRLARDISSAAEKSQKQRERRLGKTKETATAVVARQEPRKNPPSPSLDDDDDKGVSTDSEPVVDEEVFHRIGAEVMRLTGADQDPSCRLHYGRVRQWLADGFEPDLDIIPCVTDVMRRRNESGPPSSLKYFDRALVRWREERTAAVRTSSAAPATTDPELSDEDAKGWEELWKWYPRKKLPDNAQREAVAIVAAGKATWRELIHGARKYADECRRERIEQQWISLATTWLGGGGWKEYLGTLPTDGDVTKASLREPPQPDERAAALWTRAQGELQRVAGTGAMDHISKLTPVAMNGTSITLVADRPFTARLVASLHLEQINSVLTQTHGSEITARVVHQ